MQYIMKKLLNIAGSKWVAAYHRVSTKKVINCPRNHPVAGYYLVINAVGIIISIILSTCLSVLAEACGYGGDESRGACHAVAWFFDLGGALLGVLFVPHVHV